MKNTYKNKKQIKLYKTQLTLNIVTLLLLIILTIGCGGGGSSSGIPSPNPSPNTVITGVLAQGGGVTGTVEIYSIKDGEKDKLIKTVTTNNNGEYTADLGQYNGAVILFGNYTSGGTSKTLRAICDNVQNGMSVNVTPLTEIAVDIAYGMNGKLTSSNISSANQKVSDAFKIDIITTKPLDPTTDISTATQNQKDYTLILATISQMMKDNTMDIGQVINTIKTDVSDGQISDTNLKNMFITAMQNFITSSENKTKITQIPDTIAAIGGKKNIYTKLNATGTGTIYGVKFTIELPSGVAIVANGSGEIEKGIITSNISGASIVAKYTKGTPSKIDITIASASGFSAGDLAVVNLLMDSSISTPNSNQFQIKNIEAYDENGSPKTGFSVSLTIQ